MLGNTHLVNAKGLDISSLGQLMQQFSGSGGGGDVKRNMVGERPMASSETANVSLPEWIDWPTKVQLLLTAKTVFPKRFKSNNSASEFLLSPHQP